MKRSARTGSHAPADLPRQRLKRIDSVLPSILERVRATEYHTVGGSRRFRAVQRRRTWAAVRVGLLVVVGAHVFDAVVSGSAGPIVVGLDGGMVGLALAGWWSLRRQGRHHPELVAWIVASGVVLTAAATGVAVPDLAIQSAGYLLILPGLIALLLPWRTSTHLAWLGAFLVAAGGYFAVVRSYELTPDDRGDLVTVLVVAVAASLAGHVLLRRVQIRNFAQVEHIRALRRQGDAYIVQLTRAHGALRTLEATAEQLEQQALHDPLTGLANRALLGDRLTHALAQRDATVAFVMLDLDDFKAVNDRLGHAAGDELLTDVAERFMSVLRPGDTLARLGGDEFAVVAPGVKDAAVACDITTRLLEALRPPFRLDRAVGREVTTRASAGIALATAGECEAQELMRRADVALYRAKEMGKDQWQLFEASMYTEAQQPLGLQATWTERHR